MGTILLFLLLCLFGACSNSVGVDSGKSSSVAFGEDSLAGMSRVNANGALAVLGTNDEQVKMNERPQMLVRLDYEFSFGRHEVTCDEFNRLMEPATGLSLDCEDKALPATNITYYDAVLLANERSKAEGFDTAYTYSRASFDAEKRCTSLEGFAFHPEADAYRLPTEAEWSLVAAADWNPSDGWTSDNSDYRLHKVCGKADSAKQICDMVGNAMEWVNDWLGNFSGDTVSNYVGAPDGGVLGQRVVKGGSYRNSASSIKLYNRGDVYTVTSSTHADYVGFRLAFGAIPGAVWMGSDGQTATSRVVPLASSTTIHSKTGTYRVKLVFRDDISGNLAYVDYSNGSLAVTKISDTLDAYHPEISPDGKRVAFCTRIEGISGKSSLYVRNLDASGTNLVKLDVESAAIPRWRVLDNGDTVIVYVTDAGNNKEEASFRAASTWQVKFENGKFGSPEKLFDGAYHDGISEDNTLAVSGARLLRARVAKSGSTLLEAARDTVWYDSAQACNASLAKDGSKRTLFLDFGNGPGLTFVGEKYDTHERLLIADSTGKLIQSVAAPAGYSFDHSEWAVGGGNLVVATLTNASGAHTKIVLIDVSDSSIVELAEGDELWHPGLWIKEHLAPGDDSILDLDSAGIYLSENHELEQARFRIKLEKFWKRLDITKVFLAGSSRLEMGVNPDLYPEWEMLNFGVSGIDPARDLYFIRNYALNHSRNLKAIVISLDLDGWRCVEDHLELVLLGGPGYIYDMNHGFWKDGIPEGFVEAVENAFPASAEETNSFSVRGGLEPPSRGWSADALEILRDSVFTEKEMACLNTRIDDLMAVVDLAAERDIYVIGIVFPQAPYYMETGSYGLYGLQRSVASEKFAQLDSLAKAKPYFVLMDENKMGKHDYTDEMAQNRDHLSYLGARQMTARLDSVLKTLNWMSR